MPPSTEAKPDTDIYWTPAMAEALETWGEGNAWDEIQFLLATTRGRVLDIACGTGKTMQTLGQRFPALELHGCDISDFLISKAIQRGLPTDRLRVCDATQTGYPDGMFDYSYSIGSLEHFTEQGISDFLKEAARLTRQFSAHMVPVTRSGRDEGWITPHQSYYNNSVEWWLKKCREHFGVVYDIDSRWSDQISTGKWFICGHS
ncbi:class I SAM-dependent methyltransferase [Chthoniobacter flavus]|uniref:class I SAM-dependent methyltransferase n=1 Tax=Chthoniobacter flavus TaxID=191863 RepID=UPI00192A7862|nr:class I SAM-dependent methyltransferase [Chthoniobacter flavus]